VVEEAIKNQHLRLARIPTAERSTEMIRQLLFEDVEEFKIDYSTVTGKRTIGFKSGKN
jgi:hypothetical protein